MPMRPRLLALLALTLCTPAARADEGMWLLNNPPVELLKSKYGFAPTPEWIEHVQKSCVRFSTGGSGSIISSRGLVMTNHHVGSDMLQARSTPEHDLLKTGFYARTPAEEIPCPNLELDALWSIQDVTDRVMGAATPQMTAAEANAARRKVMAEIENQTKEKTGLVGQVVTLYQGARYHLYAYKRYTDVRLVFAPEKSIANFGGDTDNFEFPRYDLDVCLLRIYENGQPLKPEHFLSWSEAGAKEGDLALVIGNPGSTRRLFTTDHLKFLRDVETPMSLRRLWRSEIKLQTFAGRDAEHARIAEEDLAETANSRKFFTGQLEGLQDPRLMERKARAEAKLRSAVDANPQWRDRWGDAWTRIAGAEQARREWFPRQYVLARTDLGGDLFAHALTLVRMGDELAKPAAQRLPEFRESNLDSIRLALFSDAPVEQDLEVFRLASWLSFAAELLGADDPAVAAALAGLPPHERAAQAVRGTALKAIDARRALVDGGKPAVQASADPMIALARVLDPEMRRLRQRYEDQVEAVERENYAKIAAARFAIEGERTYPDATFTLRLAFGAIRGYQEDGRTVPPFTTFAGLFDRYQQRKGQPGFDLPQRWLDRKAALDLSTAMNFVSTADIIGGNSGSPVVNTAGQVIGLIFDGNIQSLIGGIEYDETQNRAVSVDARAIMAALRKVYDAGALADEITAR